VPRDDLCRELLRLGTLRPSPLLTAPAGDGLTGAGPVSVLLAAWAIDVAATLHRDFGDEVDITVGFLAYPSRRRAGYPARPLRPPQHYPTVDPDELEVGLAAPLTVPSGGEVWGSLWIENRSGAALAVVTHGHVTGRVVDGDGEGVGGSPRPEPATRVDVHLEPHSRHPVGLVVGAASSEPALGYVVPPGRWAVDVLLDLTDGRRLRTHPLSITVT
jgi:hypothetical protein